MELEEYMNELQENARLNVDFPKIYKMYNDVSEQLEELMDDERIIYLTFENNEPVNLSNEEYERRMALIDDIDGYFKKRNVTFCDKTEGEVYTAMLDEDTIRTLTLARMSLHNIGSMKSVFSNIHLVRWAMKLNNELFPWEDTDDFSDFDLFLAFKGEFDYEILWNEDSDYSYIIEQGYFEEVFHRIPTMSKEELNDELEKEYRKAGLNYPVYFYELQEALEEITYCEDGTYYLTDNYCDLIEELIEEDSKRIEKYGRLIECIQE